MIQFGILAKDYFNALFFKAARKIVQFPLRPSALDIYVDKFVTYKVLNSSAVKSKYLSDFRKSLTVISYIKSS